MNVQVVTTGLVPLTVNSVDRFELSGFLNGIPWVLTGGTVNLLLVDSLGGTYTFPATIAGGTASYTWTVTTPVGLWYRAWDVTDQNGLRQVTRPIPFDVVTSPA